MILDLGCIKAPYSGKTTDQAHAMGTARYMSSEQATGAKVTGQSDQVALGYILYELILGEHPYEELSRNVGGSTPYQEGIWQSLATVLPLPESICPKPVWAVINRLLAKDPNDRFPSMKEAASALRTYLASIVENRSDEVLRSLAHHPQMTPRVGGRAAVVHQARLVLPDHAIPKPLGPITAARTTISKNPNVSLDAKLKVPSLVMLDEFTREPQKRFVLAAGALMGRASRGRQPTPGHERDSDS